MTAEPDAGPDSKPVAKSLPKSADAFRTIGEASAEIGVPHHVLRFWETRFPQLQPLKRGGNRRYYRPADMAMLRAIHRMLHADGLTIRGAQKLLAEGAGSVPPPAAGRPSGRADAAAEANAYGPDAAADAAGPGTGADVAGPGAAADAAGPHAAPRGTIDLAALRAVRDRLAAALAA